MSRRLIFVVLLLLMLTTCLTGCRGGGELVRGIIREYEDNKDSINEEIHELIDSIKDELSEWKPGVDDYVGSYEAEYDKFNGKEYLFGGALAECVSGSTLKVNYSLDIQFGAAVLYCLGSTDDHNLFGDKEKHVIAEVTADDNYEFNFDAGNTFIILEGEDFTGSLSIEVE